MKSKELFALALRIVGVLGLIYLVRGTSHLAVFSAEIVILRLVYIAGGLYLVRGAPLLVTFAYPESIAEKASLQPGQPEKSA
jgi:hypothetical protein